MASKKVNYNDLKKTGDNSIASAFSIGKSVVSKTTGQEYVKVKDIREDPKGDFTEIFPFNEEMVKSIAESIGQRGFDKTQIIHLARIREEPDTMEYPIRIDGRHRVEAAKLAELEELPAYIHTFDTRSDALIYTYELQLLRRNLDTAQKFDYFCKLDALKKPGRKEEGEEPSGKSAGELAEILDMSERQVERMRNIANNGSEEVKSAVRNGEMSISKADKITNEAKRADKDEDDGASDALESCEGNSSPLGNFSHSDGIKRPDYKLSPEEDSERTLERRKAYESGKEKGSSLAYEIYEYILKEIDEGKTTDEIRQDEKFEDFSSMVIYKAFGIEE